MGINVKLNHINILHNKRILLKLKYTKNIFKKYLRLKLIAEFYC